MDSGGSLQKELRRTADMLIEISEKQGVYFAVAFLYDGSYDTKRIEALLPVLKGTIGSIK